MPAGVVVVLGDLVEAEVDVHVRHRELGGVDHAALERRIDVGRRQQLGRHAELLHDLRAEAEEAHLQSLEIGERSDPFLEPAGGLGTGRAAIDFGQAVLAIDLVLQLVTAAIDLPGEELAVLRSERHRREKASAGYLPVWKPAVL